MVAQINKQYLRDFSELRVIEVFHNGKDALAYLKDHPVELIIADITMPLMDGIGLVRNMRRNKIDTDVIVVTAANDIEHLEEMLRLGVIDYLVKPFDRQRFKKAIQKFLEKNKIFSRQHHLKQEEIDRIINAKSEEEPVDVQKGIQVVTLSRIKSYLLESQEDSFNCEQLASELNLSRVTIRRYMNYLVELGFLINTVNYETGGRPSMVYKLNDESK